MSRIEEIKSSIQQIARTNQQLGIVFTAEVVSANEATADVQFGDFIFTGVKLFSIEAAGGLLVKPKVGSMVTVLDLSEGKYRDMVIIKCDTPELVKMEINGLEVEINGVSGKVALKNSATSFKDLLNELVKEVNAAIITTPAGAGTVSPATQAKLKLIDNKINQLFA